MKKRLGLYLAALAAAVLLGGCGTKAKPVPEAQTVQESEKETQEAAGPEEGQIRLEDDYYSYVNHELLEETEIPADADSWSYFYQLSQDAYKELDEVLKEAVDKREEQQPGSLEQKIADFYLTALDLEGRRKAGFGELKPYMESIQNASTIKEYLDSVSRLNSELGYYSIIAPIWAEDMTDSSRYVCYLYGADLGPGKETLEDASLGELLNEYQAYIQRTLEFTGMEKEAAAQAASEILAFQKDLAASELSLAEGSDPEKIYNVYSLEDLKLLLSNTDAEELLRAFHADGQESYIVPQEELMKKINTYLTEEHLSLLKEYSLFCLVQDFSPYLTPEIRDNYLNWVNYQKGIAEKSTEEKQASEMTQDILGFEFGQLYVKKCFSEDDKQNIQDMIEKILKTYENRIQGLDWMGEETKTAAIKKLKTMTLKIGYPDKWPDAYAKAVVKPTEEGGCLIDNFLSLVKAANEVNQEKYRKPVDKTEWIMTPQTVNAYYNPNGNEIVFPAAILQAPFYDSEADFASNLGGIGMVIAHEVSHAFDSNGSLYDENGNYNVWWTDEDRARFKELSQEIIAYYDGQEGFEGRFVNGTQTLNENIADLGSMNCITAIVGDDEDSLKLLFHQYAVIWAGKYTSESMIQRLNMDVHSPGKVRVNAVLGTTEAFYKAYPELKEGDKMYVAPQNWVKIW